MRRDIYKISIMLLLVISCNDTITPPLVRPKYSDVLKGKVMLENQIEYSNALVYIDNLNRGVSSDSSGNYTILFNEGDSIYTGEFKLIYFLNDYEMDSAKFFLEKGKVKLDMLDVDSEGKIKTKELKQILRVEGWTDKQEYRTGEEITFTARFTNVTNRMVQIYITNARGKLGSVVLYSDKYPPFVLSGCDIVLIDLEIDLYRGYYEAIVKYRIRDRYYCDNNEPLIFDEYIVATGFFIEGRLLNQFQSEFNKYVLEEWWKICRGKSPNLDAFPNKYQFPHIRIIQ